MSFFRKIQALGWALDADGKPASRFGGPMIIAHRGASDHAQENTLPAFELATRFGADMWELDVRNTADGIPVISHDDNLERVFGVDATISSLTLDQLQALENVHVPTLEEAIILADHLDTGLYIEIKGEGASLTSLKLLQEKFFGFAALGSFIPDYLADLAECDCPYPLSVLVGPDHDPFELANAAYADAIHLCWERASDRPDQLLNDALVERARAEDLPIILWHEERPEVIRKIMQKDVIGVCSNRPELLVPYASSSARPSGFPKGPEVVCHRGINKLAPENSLEAARLTFEQGFDWLELDVHQTADNHLVVIHDGDLDRTTNGSGPVASKTLSELRALDAGSWFSDQYAGAQIPTLAEMVDLAKAWNKRIYIEIKQADPKLVLDLVHEKGFLDHCFFWSFEWSQIETLRQLEPKANIMARTIDYPSLDALFETANPTIVEINIREEIKDEIDRIRARGAKSMLCDMGEDTAIMERIISLAPDMVNLDNPHLWKETWHRSLLALGGKTLST